MKRLIEFPGLPAEETDAGGISLFGNRYGMMVLKDQKSLRCAFIYRFFGSLRMVLSSERIPREKMIPGSGGIPRERTIPGSGEIPWERTIPGSGGIPREKMIPGSGGIPRKEKILRQKMEKRKKSIQVRRGHGLRPPI